MSLFMAAKRSVKAPLNILGLPYDGTASFRPGARFGPPAIREAVWGLETYDPALELDLEDLEICDWEDIEIPFGSPSRALATIETFLSANFEVGQKILALGGEHLLSLPMIMRLAEIYGKERLWVVQFDAHADLRTDYLGEPLSHACIIRRVADILGFKRIRQLGIRSGTKEEWAIIREQKTLVTIEEEALAALKKQIGEDPLYITVDLDALDPSVMPGTGTPEPGGISFNSLNSALMAFRGLNIVGADAMELAPNLDTSGVSSVTAAKIARTLLLIMSERSA